MSNASNHGDPSASEQALQTMMQQANIPSQRALAEKAKVSRWQVQQLRQGNIDTMRVTALKKLAAALECSLAELFQAFDPEQSTAEIIAASIGESTSDEVARLRQEYARLEQRLEQQSQYLQEQFQADSLQVLESWLTYWPTAAKAATEHDGFDAKKLLPLVKPVERLLESWGVTVIGTVGQQLSYDPQQHQLVRGMANPEDLVRVSHVGYRHGGNLLQRVKVVPLNP
ncbi:helix-turn-helix domain-containing protein [Leptolyngbyaceae cyanobacterium CCMR0082]|uniref:Helix-turn-helix domain-containing protein n=2 Tax=Adonisia turfae TaxID=2950184 RepID=A0A6M0S215_9CYAN|nr:helix-turn-helix transcriptional regulator [Adonisia turfae]NEZ59388.1 helix-turn-helix domain-containing protein [Adonisia turfae CCMR0081]NEZ62133.1 helix-turn-helix domain-containing protein [Adonisia turfae CCMR0082]